MSCFFLMHRLVTTRIKELVLDLDLPLSFKGHFPGEPGLASAH